MKKLMIAILLCGCTTVQAQSNFVLNPSFEEFSKCPSKTGTIYYSKYWRNAVDSLFTIASGSDYYNVCADTGIYDDATIPSNTNSYQYPHSGNAMVGTGMYYDKTPPSPPSYVPFDVREYTQGHLVKPLQNGKTYCVSFWVNLAEVAGYAHNKIGAYLDNGSINTAVDSAGKEITSVVPQVYTDSVIKDTMNWTKIDGSFVANGTEIYITIGLFFTNAATTTVVTNYWFTYPQYSYYLIDDVSVIPIDLKADAGADKWAEQTKKVQIGRVGDSTAVGLDCKWYHKGSLIDSGAIISVNANAIKGAIDTYIVVQTVCGNITRDTVAVSTVGLGITSPSPAERDGERLYSLFPNPNEGIFVMKQLVADDKNVQLKVYNAIGALVYKSNIVFKNGQANVQMGEKAAGVYLACIGDEKGRTICIRFAIK